MTDKIVDFVVYKFSICIHLVFHALHFGFGNGHRVEVKRLAKFIGSIGAKCVYLK